jgi:hypothetical protein
MTRPSTNRPARPAVLGERTAPGEFPLSETGSPSTAPRSLGASITS